MESFSLTEIQETVYHSADVRRRQIQLPKASGGGMRGDATLAMSS